MKINGDDVIFSTGRLAYANNGIIGIGPNMTIYDGYDGIFCLDMESGDFTSTELVELADYMIEQWTKFRAKLAKGVGDE